MFRVESRKILYLRTQPGGQISLFSLYFGFVSCQMFNDEQDTFEIKVSEIFQGGCLHKAEDAPETA